METMATLATTPGSSPYVIHPSTAGIVASLHIKERIAKTSVVVIKMKPPLPTRQEAAWITAKMVKNNGVGLIIY